MSRSCSAILTCPMTNNMGHLLRVFWQRGRMLCWEACCCHPLPLGFVSPSTQGRWPTALRPLCRRAPCVRTSSSLWGLLSVRFKVAVSSATVCQEVNLISSFFGCYCAKSTGLYHLPYQSLSKSGVLCPTASKSFQS